MKKEDLISLIFKKKSYLCVGLDSDFQKIPPFLKEKKNPIFEFNRQIIEATHDLVVAYKLNTAFYEALGCKGWKSLSKTANYIKTQNPNIFLIADAKRGDIGNTSEMYAKAFFETMPFDAVTLSPYMGKDVVTPFLKYPDKWVILLALTSNKSAEDFQFYPSFNAPPLYEYVVKKSKNWTSSERMMYVVGATQPERLRQLRELLPEHFFLIPGVGTQGGNLRQVIQFGKNKDGGILINASRSIIFSDNTKYFARAARGQALELQKKMGF